MHVVEPTGASNVYSWNFLALSSGRRSRRYHMDTSPTTSHGDDHLVYDVIRAVADAKGIDPLGVETRVNDVVDPDALDRLFRDRPNGTSRIGGYLVFYMCDCEVVVSGDMTVEAQLLSAGDGSTEE